MPVTRRDFMASLAALGLAACAGRSGSPFPELRAAGEPGDLGLAQGRAFADRIRANLAFYVDWIPHSEGHSKERLLELARGFEDVIGNQFPDMLEEIDGVARGAKLSLDEVLLINARTDVYALVEAEAASLDVPACTALALRGSVNGVPALALAQNWDWNNALSDAPVILRLRPSHGPALVSLVEAGMIGKIGFNEDRLGVCLNFLSHVSDGDPTRLGVPIHLLLRAALNCRSLDEVVQSIDAVPRCASANFLLAQHDADGPRALDLEITPVAVAVTRAADSDLIHTNHFLDSTLAEGSTSGRGPSTTKRYARAVKLASELSTTEVDPVRRAQTILECREDLPYPISRFGNPTPSSSTLAGIVMDLTRNRFVLTRGAPHMRPWVETPGV